jgi:hypothetical protein
LVYSFLFKLICSLSYFSPWSECNGLLQLEGIELGLSF